MQKHYIDAATLLKDSVELALKVIENAYYPDLVVGIWRGGSTVAITMQEVFDFIGLECQHLPVVTRSYNGMKQQASISIEGLALLDGKVNTNGRILLVDDVWDTGRTIDSLLEALLPLLADRSPEIRVAVPYFKPGINQSPLSPDFHLHETDQWLVFPHELLGLNEEELVAGKNDLDGTLHNLLELRNRLGDR